MHYYCVHTTRVCLICPFVVSEEANFMMNSTNLTVGGFTQPAIARNIIEIPSNSEKGLSHHFIWVFPKPLYQEFSELGKTNQTFIQRLGKKFVYMIHYNGQIIIAIL